MHKLLIVDDEKVPREGMVSMIPWADYDIEVIGTATDGLDALEQIRRNPPDIVLTDIRMPRMDGLELLHVLKEEFAHISTMIISGYDEFEYAKQAIRCGVEGYLLKPLDPTELIRLVLEVLHTRKATTAGAEPRDELDMHLRNLLYACYTPEQQEEAAERFPALAGQWHRILLLQLENIRDALSDQPRSVYRTLMDSLDRHCREHPAACVVEKSPHSILIVLHMEDKQQLSSETHMLLDRLTDTLQGAHYQEYVIGVSRVNQSVEMLGEMYVNTMRIVNMKYIYGNGKAYFVGKRYEVTWFESRMATLTTQLVACTFAFAQGEIDQLMLEQYKIFRREKICLSEIQLFARSLLRALMEKAAENDLNMEDVYGDSGSIILSICTSNSRREIMSRLTDFMNTVGGYLNQHRNVSPEKLCQNIRDYVARNYDNPELSTCTIAENFHFSASYLSSVFSGVCQTTLTNHINSLRMEKACHLLRETDAKISQIAEKVGFVHTSYFCTVFKRVVGISPTDYRAEGGRWNGGAVS